MSGLTLLGFPRSTFVQIVGLILTHKSLSYRFRDLEPDMGSPAHLALHPFDRVPILQHGDFTLYETSAIVAYLEEVFPMPSAAARERPGPRADEPMDQRGQFLLLSVHVLSRLARA
jgi:glutathione S-transferase